MSEKRWYYTDPLAAAWMTAHHGLKLFIPRHRWFDRVDFDIGVVGLCHEIVEEDRMNGRHDRYYVHPDSLHLLEPHDNDIVGGIDSDGFTAAVVSIRKGTFGMGTNIVWAGSEQYRRYRGEKIIQRDGNPFFWPECEGT